MKQVNNPANKPKKIGFLDKVKEMYKHTYTSNTVSGRKQVRRNQISFVLCLFAIYYALDCFHIDTHSLLRKENRNGLKSFIYCSAISTFLVMFSITKFISRVYLILLPFVAKLVFFLGLILVDLIRISCKHWHYFNGVCDFVGFTTN
jgi:hypothetical protein